MKGIIGGLLIALLVALLPAVNALTVDQVDSALGKLKPEFVKEGDVFGVVAEKNTKWVSQSANYFDKMTAVEETKTVLYRTDRWTWGKAFRSSGLWFASLSSPELANRRSDKGSNADGSTYRIVKQTVWYDQAKLIVGHHYVFKGKNLTLVMIRGQDETGLPDISKAELLTVYRKISKG